MPLPTESGIPPLGFDPFAKYMTGGYSNMPASAFMASQPPTSQSPIWEQVKYLEEKVSKLEGELSEFRSTIQVNYTEANKHNANPVLFTTDEVRTLRPTVLMIKVLEHYHQNCVPK